MDMRVLPHVDRGQVKAERLDASQQPQHAEQTGVLAAVRAQARVDHAQVTLELGGGGVAAGIIAPRRLQTGRHQAEQHAVGHVVIPRGNRGQRLGELGAIGRDPLAHAVAHARPGS